MSVLSPQRWTDEQIDPETMFKKSDILAAVASFDAEWYLKSYPDAALLGMPPLEHFGRFGLMLRRGVSARLPSLEHQTELVAALSRKPVISYCIPIMNRPDDIRGTLQYNLNQGRPIQDRLEFVVVFMDEDHSTHEWVRSDFEAELASGYLRMIVEPPMDGWHFCKAKNRHRNYAVGSVFSSLDGDNFVTRQEMEQLLDIYARYGERFVFHHFTGLWGDGSSGRVSLPMRLYEEVGYDERLMPRQYDEMDLILSVLCRDPKVPLIRVRAENHGLSSKRSVSFMKRAGLNNEIVEVDAVDRRSPLNPKTADYVDEDPSMAAMQAFNQFFCFMKNARTPELRQEYLGMAVKARHQLIDVLPATRICGILFKANGNPAPEDLQIGEDDVCVFACMKNDDSFLPAYYEHYKARGVAHFFIVDDGSDVPIGRILPYPDVHVFYPKVGNFVTAKGLWLEGLMKAYLKEGLWALTLDADEFADLPAGYDRFPDLVRDLRLAGRDHLPGMMIDMLPAPNVSEEALARSSADFLEVFDHVADMPLPVSEDYAKAGAIRWGFGPHAHLSWQIDARYHAFGTFDALRKIPLITLRTGRHVNQGFHTVHFSDGTPDPGTEIWESDMILPLRHFKLVKMFSREARARMAAQVASADTSPYHARTTENIARIFGAGDEALAKLLSLPSRVYKRELFKPAKQ